MNLSHMLPEIKKRRDLKIYYKIVFEFINYINATREQRFRFRGILYENGDIDPITSEVEYIHRWTLPYVKGWKKKLYQLDEWYRSQPDLPVTMITQTTYQAGKYSRLKKGRAITIPESFELQKHGWKKLHRMITRDYGKFDYVSIIEPHLENDTGYPHTHIPVFLDIDESDQERYIRVWAEKYKIGSEDHGLRFSPPAGPGGRVLSVRNYLMKYLSKGFLATGSKFGDEPISPGHLVFHAICWKHQYRIFGASRHLSRVMGWDRSGNTVDWLATSILDPSGDERVVWMAEDRPGTMKMKDFVNQEFGVELE